MPNFSKLVHQINKFSARFRPLVPEMLWLGFGQLFVLVSGFILIRVLTHQLSPSSYGIYSLWITIVGLGNQVYFGAYGSSFARYYSVATHRHQLNPYMATLAKVIKNSFLLAGALATTSILLWILSPKNPDLFILAGFAILLTVTSGTSSLFQAISNAARDRQKAAVALSIENSLKIFFLTTVYAVSANNSPFQTIVISFLASLISLVWLYNSLGFHRLTRKVALVDAEISQWRALTSKFAQPLIFSGVFNWAFFSSQRWALEFASGSSAVGKFFALSQLTYIPATLLFGFVLSLITPIIFNQGSDLSDKKRIKRGVRIIDLLSIAVVLASLLLSAFLLVYGKQYLLFFLPSGYSTNVLQGVLLIFSSGILHASIVSGQALSLVNKPEMILSLSTVGQLVLIAFNFFFAAFYGINGLVYSILLGSLIHLIWMRVLVFRTLFAYKSL